MASVNRPNPRANAKKKQALSKLNGNKYKIAAAADASGDGTNPGNADSLNSTSLLKSLNVIGNADLLGLSRRPSPLVDLTGVVARPQPISQKTVLISKPARPKKSEEFLYFTNNNVFAQKYIDEFIKQTFVNEIIPDILIDTLKSMDVDRTFYENYRYPTYYEEPKKVEIVDKTEIIELPKPSKMIRSDIRFHVQNNMIDHFMLDHLLNKVRFKSYEGVYQDNIRNLMTPPIQKHPYLNGYLEPAPSPVSVQKGKTYLIVPDRYLKADSLFLNNFIEDFIKEQLKSELIPSVALEVMAKMRKDEVTAAAAKASAASDKVLDIEPARKAVAQVDLRPYQTVDPVFSTDFLDQLEYKAKYARKANYFEDKKTGP